MPRVLARSFGLLALIASNVAPYAGERGGFVETSSLPGRPAIAERTVAGDLREYFERTRRDFTIVDPRPSTARLRFEESSRGLPVDGSWRNSLAVADINEDGLPDLIAPPQRGDLAGTPHVFVQNRDHSWREWDGISWPRSLDYGSVAAADVNRDGHVDLIFGVHLSGIAVFLGDGRGGFTDASEGLPHDFGTRCVAVADVDRDGWPDLVALSEGPAAVRQPHSGARSALLRVYQNQRGRPWQMIDVSGAAAVAGDWLAVGDFNGDGLPDFVTSNIYFNSPEILYLSDGSLRWRAAGRGIFALYSNYFAVAAARLRRESRADGAVVSYGRAWPTSAVPEGVQPPAVRSAVGIDVVRWERGEPRIRTVARWPSQRPVWGLAAADFDGDGRVDLAYVDADRREVVFLVADRKGQFRRVTTEGIGIPPHTAYDLRAADIDGDGRPDIVLMFEAKSDSSTRNGSIRVYLNRSAAHRRPHGTATIGSFRHYSSRLH